MVRSIKGTVEQVLVVAGQAAIVAMVVNIVADVFSREVLQIPFLTGTLEYVQFWWMVILTFLGMALAERDREHIDVPMLAEYLHKRAVRIIDYFGVTLMSLVLTGMAWYGLVEAWKGMQINEQTAGVGLVIWPPKFIVPIAVAAFLVYAVRNCIRDRRNDEINKVEQA